MKESDEFRTRPGGFPSTHWSVLAQGRASMPGSPPFREAVETLARLYWKPVYAYLRLQWRRTRDEAMDLTQEFFLGMLEGKRLPAGGADQGRFRAYLKKSLDNLVKNEFRKGRALRRGGGARELSIEWSEDPDGFLLPHEGDSPEEILDRHWRKTVLLESLRRMEEEYRETGRGVYYEIFKRHELEPDPNLRPTYEALATEYAIRRTDVDNFLAHARRRIRELVREALLAAVGRPEELAEEEEAFYRSPP